MSLADHNPASYLREMHASLAQGNPRYSLRAFAKKIGLSPGGLTQVLLRRKRLSLDRAHTIAGRLKLSARETERFLLLVQIDGSESMELKSQLHEKLQELSGGSGRAFSLEVDQFRIITEWYGLAILEYISESRTNQTAPGIAKFFGLNQAEVAVTLDRLERLELIERTASGKYRRVPDRLIIRSSTPNEAIRGYYLGVLEKARQSIQEQTPQEKVIGTEVLNFDPTDLDEARKLTDDYFARMLKLANKGKQKTHVYQLMVDFFRLGSPGHSNSKKENLK